MKYVCSIDWMTLTVKGQIFQENNPSLFYLATHYSEYFEVEWVGGELNWLRLTTNGWQRAAGSFAKLAHFSGSMSVKSCSQQCLALDCKALLAMHKPFMCIWAHTVLFQCLDTWHPPQSFDVFDDTCTYFTCLTNKKISVFMDVCDQIRHWLRRKTWNNVVYIRLITVVVDVL
jgi:hypothetical protein